MPTADDFRIELKDQIERARRQGRPHIEVNSGELHRVLGGYPNASAHQMPTCCEVMRSEMGPRDEIIFSPKEGNGASVTIKYYTDD